MLSRRAALSCVAFVCVGLFALHSLTDRSTCRAADPPAAKPKVERQRRQRPPQLPNSLIGRLRDETGAPVDDARLELYPKEGGGILFAQTLGDGSFAIGRVPSAGVYHVRIFSRRCVSLFDDRDDNLDVRLDPPNTVTRDFVLKPACQLHLTIVDEEGHPIPKVAIYKPGRYSGEFLRTDRAGQVIIGGLAPSPLQSRFGLQHKDFVIEALEVKLDDPKTIVERQVTLSHGKSVRGTVTCSDGKPASGCRILALPSWWDFNRFPLGAPIQGDGSFELEHIGLGTYKIAVSMPKGKNGLISRECLVGADLYHHNDPLALKLDVPSLGSMRFIEGRIHFEGDRRPKRGFWIHVGPRTADALDADLFAQHDDRTFKVGPLPAGKYTLTVESAEIESKSIGPLAVGTKNVELNLTVRGPMVLKGVITGDDGQPLTDVRFRLLQTRNLGGRYREPNKKWQPVADLKGTFTAEVPGPGVYVVEASAEGYAITKSPPASSETDLNKELSIKLSRGLSLEGRVVDEAGHAINGATVVAQSQVEWLPVSAAKLPSRAGVVTSAGRFKFEHLNPGQETIRALHPDYVFAEARHLELKEGGPQAPVTLTMKQGGTVRGRVFDASGRPAAGVSLHFRDSMYHFAGESEEVGEFAAGATDEAGEYEVAHLPESLIYVTQGGPWSSSLGVFRQAVLPASGKTSRVDFGGIKKVTGRIVVNGAPLANTRVLLSEEEPGGKMMAYAMTEADGSFAFRGIPLGERYLYYAVGTGLRQHWVRVKPLRIETSNDAFGTIDFRTATLAVHYPDADPNVPGEEKTNAWLLNYHGFSVPRRTKDDPWVFRDVPLGKWELSLNRPHKFGLVQAVEITGPGEKSIMLEVPKGSAALQGKVKALPPMINRYLILRSKDKRFFADIYIKPDGTFEFEGLPAGEYFLRQGTAIETDPLATLTLSDGEKKSISLPTLDPPGNARRGLLQVRPYTADGLPLPGCEVTLTGVNGAIPSSATQMAQISFLTQPGMYRLSVRYPGFVPVTKQVEVKAMQNQGWGSGNELNVTLARADH